MFIRYNRHTEQSRIHEANLERLHHFLAGVFAENKTQLRLFGLY